MEETSCVNHIIAKWLMDGKRSRPRREKPKFVTKILKNIVNVHNSTAGAIIIIIKITEIMKHLYDAQCDQSH